MPIREAFKCMKMNINEMKTPNYCTSNGIIQSIQQKMPTCHASKATVQTFRHKDSVYVEIII